MKLGEQDYNLKKILTFKSNVNIIILKLSTKKKNKVYRFPIQK